MSACAKAELKRRCEKFNRKRTFGVSVWRYRERGVNGERGLLRAKDKMKDRG